MATLGEAFTSARRLRLSRPSVQWLVDAGHLAVTRANMFEKWLAAPRGDVVAAETQARLELAAWDLGPEDLPPSIRALAAPEVIVQLRFHEGGRGMVGRLALFVRDGQAAVAYFVGDELVALDVTESNRIDELPAAIAATLRCVESLMGQAIHIKPMELAIATVAYRQDPARVDDSRRPWIAPISSGDAMHLQRIVVDPEASLDGQLEGEVDDTLFILGSLDRGEHLIGRFTQGEPRMFELVSPSPQQLDAMIREFLRL